MIDLTILRLVQSVLTGCFRGLPTIRAGGQEIGWMGDRGDSLGDKDIYCARRH